MRLRRLGELAAATLAILIVLVGCTVPSESTSDYGSPSHNAGETDVASHNPESQVSDDELSAEILDQLFYEEIQPHYRAAGLTLDFSEWESLSEAICLDMRAGGDGYFTTGDMQGIPQTTQANLAEDAWTLMALACDASLSEYDLERVIELQLQIYPEYSRRLAAVGIFPPAGGESSQGDEPHEWGYTYDVPSISQFGNRVRCSDGSYSGAGGKQGACSWHGGIAK